MRLVAHENYLQRCPDCGEAIKCDEPIPCLSQFHEQEPEMVVRNPGLMEACLEAPNCINHISQRF